MHARRDVTDAISHRLRCCVRTAGDFLMPYLLSVVDKGKGMMTMLNETPIDYLTWGNHEADMSHANVMAREKEYRGCWINSNMKEHESFAASTCQTDVAWITLKGSDGNLVRKVAMLGVMTNSSNKAGAFGGATIDDPWKCMAEYTPKVKAAGADLIIPLCHLYEPQDERTAREFDFPVILSGHDHHVVDKTIAGSRILKPGLDAHKAIIVDLVWSEETTKQAASSAPACSPTISAQTVRVADWAPDAALLVKVQSAYRLIDNLRNTQLTVVPPKFRPLTSENARGAVVTMGSYLCSVIRDALNTPTINTSGTAVDGVIIKAGACPRGSRTYADDEHITLEALQMEIQEHNEIFIYTLPGKAIKYGLREQWGGLPNPGWMQHDDLIVCDAQTGLVVSINGAPIEEDRMYHIGSASDFPRRSDGETIGAWFMAHPECLPDADSGAPPHTLLISHWAEQIWETVFAALDRDGDGELTKEELAALDANGDGSLDRQELLACLRKQGFKTYNTEMGFVDVLLRCAGDEDQDGVLTVDEINRSHAHKASQNSVCQLRPRKR